MKFVLPLLLVLFILPSITAQIEPLSTEAFIPSNDREQGTAEISGDLNKATDELNLAIDFRDFSSPMADAYIHFGTPENPGKRIFTLNLLKDETSNSGRIGRLLFGGVEPTFTKETSKAQASRRIDFSQFDELATAIEADNACIILQIRGNDGILRPTFSAPLRLASAVNPVPTMSQWAILVLGLILSCMALVVMKKKVSIRI